MKSKLLPLLFAVVSAAPAFAATKATENKTRLTDDGCQQTIAVASACVTNTTDYQVTFAGNWGLDGEEAAQVVLNPGDTWLNRLVLDAQQDLSLTLEFPAGPTSNDVANLVIPATWGTERQDDCSLLPSYEFQKQDTDGGDPIFVVVPAIQQP